MTKKTSTAAAALEDKRWALKAWEHLSWLWKRIPHPAEIFKHLSSGDPSCWLPVACVLPPLAPVSTPSQPGASVGNSEHLWLHWRTCGYSLEKKPGQTHVSPSCSNSPGFLSFYLIIQVYSPQPELQLGGLRLESTNHLRINHHHNVIPKSLPEKLYCAPIHLNLNQAAETCSDFYDCISYFNAVLVTLTCKAVAGKWICFTRLGPWIMVSHNYWTWSSTLISNSSTFNPLIISLNYFIIRKEILKSKKGEQFRIFFFAHRMRLIYF